VLFKGGHLRDLTGGRWTTWRSRAATRSVAVAVLLQGLLFGLVHAYQGWKHVIVIVVLGILYGTLVAWRRNLRASILFHAWSDLFEGWLRFL
jgi:membrane protease YdiL (CAAX protease family)